MCDTAQRCTRRTEKALRWNQEKTGVAAVAEAASGTTATLHVLPCGGSLGVVILHMAHVSVKWPASCTTLAEGACVCISARLRFSLVPIVFVSEI